MSFFSIGRNEIKSLEKLEEGLRSVVDEGDQHREETEGSPASPPENVCSFQEIILNKEITKLRNKMAVLKKGSPGNRFWANDDSDDNDDNDGELA
jgi:hypothetical protein